MEKEKVMEWFDNQTKEKQKEIWEQFVSCNPNNLNFGTYIGELMKGGNKYLTEKMPKTLERMVI